MLCAMGLDEGPVFLSPFFLGGRQELGLCPRSRLDAATLFQRLKKCSPVEESQVKLFIRLPQALPSLLPA